MGGGFAVGDHDDLLRAGLLFELGPREQQRVLHVGAPLEIPAEFGEQLGLDVTSDTAERHEAEVVIRKLSRDERVQRHRDLLGRQEVVPHWHRHRYVEQQHRRTLRHNLGAFDFEVGRRQPHRRAAALARDGVADRLLDVQVERVTELVGLVLVGTLVPDAVAFDRVSTRPIFDQVAEQIAERLLAERSHTLRGELVPTVALVDQTGVLEHLGHVL